MPKGKEYYTNPNGPNGKPVFQGGGSTGKEAKGSAKATPMDSAKGKPADHGVNK